MSLFFQIVSNILGKADSVVIEVLITAILLSLQACNKIICCYRINPVHVLKRKAESLYNSKFSNGVDVFAFS